MSKFTYAGGSDLNTTICHALLFLYVKDYKIN